MPLDPLAPFATTAPEMLAERNADLDRRLKVQERRPMLNRAPWQTPAFANGFGHFSSGYAEVGYYIDGQGQVHFRGVASMPVTFAPLTMFTLAAGYRPVARHAFVTAFPFADSIATAVISVDSNGVVQLDAGGPSFGGGVSLDTISFRVI